MISIIYEYKIYKNPFNYLNLFEIHYLFLNKYPGLVFWKTHKNDTIKGFFVKQFGCKCIIKNIICDHKSIKII
jgi:hypothetical protein